MGAEVVFAAARAGPAVTTVCIVTDAVVINYKAQCCAYDALQDAEHLDISFILRMAALIAQRAVNDICGSPLCQSSLE